MSFGDMIGTMMGTAVKNREHKIRRSNLRDALDTQRLLADMELGRARLAQDDVNSQRQYDATTRGQDIGQMNNGAHVAAQLYGIDKTFESNSADRTLRALTKRAEIQAAAEEGAYKRFNDLADSYTDAEGKKDLEKSGTVKRFVAGELGRQKRGFASLTPDEYGAIAGGADLAIHQRNQQQPGAFMRFFGAQRAGLADDVRDVVPRNFNGNYVDNAQGNVGLDNTPYTLRKYLIDSNK